MDLCQPVVLTGLNRFKPGKTEFMPASGMNLCNFSRFKRFKPLANPDHPRALLALLPAHGYPGVKLLLIIGGGFAKKKQQGVV